jgi:hypothetical protein
MSEAKSQARVVTLGRTTAIQMSGLRMPSNQPISKWEQGCPLGITHVAGTNHKLLRQIAVEF